MGQEMEVVRRPEPKESYLAIAPGCSRCMGSVQTPTLQLGRRMKQLGWSVGEIVVVQLSRDSITVSRLEGTAAFG